jgi:hypothetical protein
MGSYQIYLDSPLETALLEYYNLRRKEIKHITPAQCIQEVLRKSLMPGGDLA